jgi:20S proteasome subunit alpha 6
MYRNQYDTDVTVWSPAGRLHQVEYAMEAVKQGSVCLGLRSNDYVVLAALKRSPNPLASFQKKLISIDGHIGIAISGLTADGRSIAKWMRSECLNHQYVYGAPYQSQRLVEDLADRQQRTTQTYVRRPYGVGLLIASYDQTGPHLFQTDPSGNYYEYLAMAQGSRAQSAKTYLERHYESFHSCSLQELLTHSVKALASALHGDLELTKENVSLGVVGKDQSFSILSEEDAQTYLDLADVADGGMEEEDEDGKEDERQEPAGDDAVA